jgi:transposase-like protein
VAKLIESGMSQHEVAAELGISRSTVARIVAKMPEPELRDRPEPPEVETGDPAERLKGVRNLLLTMAENPGGYNINDVKACCAAAKGAMDAHRYLERTAAMPFALPDDDDDAQDAIMQVWWQAARNGSASATQKLAHALGVRAIRRKGVTITYERPDPEDYPRSSARSPGGSSSVH